MPDRNYLASALRSQRERGTQPDEDWYRLKVTGMGETVWINVSPETLDAIIAAVAEPGIVEAARELLDICDWPRRYDQEDYDRAVSALRDVTPPKPTTPIERWRWEDRGERGWWRINDELAIEDGPHSEPDPF